VGPGAGRKLGAQLLLNQAQLEEFHSLRSQLFQHVKETGDLTEKLLPTEADASVAPGHALNRGQLQTAKHLPMDFKTQLAFIQKHLRDARVAAFSEEAFLDMKAALVAMRRMLDQAMSKVGGSQ
jgi:hypothetical protein